MSLHRRARLLLALAIALGVQTAYVNPGVAAAELRALTCCARHCDAPISLPSARDCCGLTMTASGPLEAPAAPAIAPDAATHVIPTNAAPALTPAWHPAEVVRPTASGPPTFLEQRHLLL